LVPPDQQLERAVVAAGDEPLQQLGVGGTRGGTAHRLVQVLEDGLQLSRGHGTNLRGASAYLNSALCGVGAPMIRAGSRAPVLSRPLPTPVDARAGTAILVRVRTGGSPERTDRAWHRRGDSLAVVENSRTRS